MVSNARPFRRRLSRAQDELARVLGPLDGARVHGGCDTCDAWQTVAPTAPGVWTLTVHHDNDCPHLKENK